MTASAVERSEIRSHLHLVGRVGIEPTTKGL